MRVRFDECRRRRARRECKNGRRCLKEDAEGGYANGDRREGIIIRWRRVGGCWLMIFVREVRIGTNGEVSAASEDSDCGGGGIKDIFAVGGIVKRFVRSNE